MSKVWAGLELGMLAALHSPRGILCPVPGSLLKGVLLAWPVPIRGCKSWSLEKLGCRREDLGPRECGGHPHGPPVGEDVEALGMDGVRANGGVSEEARCGGRG